MKKVCILLFILSFCLITWGKGMPEKQPVRSETDTSAQSIQQELPSPIPLPETNTNIFRPADYFLTSDGNGDITNDLPDLGYGYTRTYTHAPADGVTRLLIYFRVDTGYTRHDNKGNKIPSVLPVTFSITSLEEGSLSTLESQNERSLTITVTPVVKYGWIWVYAVYNVPSGKDWLLANKCKAIVHAREAPPTNADFYSNYYHEGDLFVTAVPPTKCGPEGCALHLPGTEGLDLVNPQTENIRWQVRDLSVWGTAGEEALTWMRYRSSQRSDYFGYQYDRYLRYFGSNDWVHSYQYDMIHIPVPEDSGSRVLIHYPDGEQNVFIEIKKGSGIWKTEFAGVDKQLFQKDDTLILQKANGFRYRFVRYKKNVEITYYDIHGKIDSEIKGVSIYYRLEGFQDSRQNVYTLKYDNDNRLTRITEPGGRYFEILYYTNSYYYAPVISKVTTSDGRSVQYKHDYIYDYSILTSVDYDDGTQGNYSGHHIDPRYEGPLIDPDFKYVSTGKSVLDCQGNNITNLQVQLLNGVTGKLLATLDTTSEKKTITYPNGRKQVYEMPAVQQGNIKSYTDGYNSKTEYEYDDDGVGFLKSEKDVYGRTTTYERSIYGNPTKITYPDGTTEVWERDKETDLVLTYTNQLQQVTTYHRDSRNRIERIDYFDGSYETFTNYNSFGQAADHQRRNRGTEHSEYDGTGLLRKFTDAAGNTTGYDYDDASRLKTVTDARGNATAYEYNNRGQITKLTHPGGSFIKYDYDTLGNQTVVTNELKKTWTTKYDEFRRPTSISDPLNTTTNEYDLPGDIISYTRVAALPKKITLPSGKVTAIQYDLEWQKKEVTVGTGTAEAAHISYQYDKVGNQKVITDPLGKLWKTDYDDMDRVKSKSDPLSNTIQYRYDAVGRVDTIIRPDKGITTYAYLDDIHTIQILEQGKRLTKQVYDEEGNMVSVLNPKSKLTQFAYDSLNRLRKKIYPGGNLFEEYTYDEVGNVKTYRNRAGNTRTFTYDTRNRPAFASWDDGKTPSVTYYYDDASRLTSVFNNISSISYEYNDANEPVSNTQAVTAILSSPRTIKYKYNQDGLLQLLTYPGGETKTYDYTPRNQLRAIVDNGLLVFYNYDLNGNVHKKDLKNNTEATYGYDDANRMLNVEHRKGKTIIFNGLMASSAKALVSEPDCPSTLARFDYGYDKVDRRTFVQRDHYKGDVFGYDAIDRLTNVKYQVINPDGNPGPADSTVQYDLDSAGNRRSVTENISTGSGNSTKVFSYESNDLNQYTNISESDLGNTLNASVTAGESSLEYTPNGNLKTFGVWTYEYDAQDRLIRATSENKEVTFSYDPLDRCVIYHYSDDEESSISLRYYDEGRLIEERDVNGALINKYIYGGQGELLTKTSEKETVYYHYDGQDNVVRLTNEEGEPIEYYTYDTFGYPIILDKAGQLHLSSYYDNRFLFAGGEYLWQMNLYNFDSRMYAPGKLGRFLQADPDNNMNEYSYAENDPVNASDKGYWSGVAGGIGAGAMGTVEAGKRLSTMKGLIGLVPIIQKAFDPDEAVQYEIGMIDATTHLIENAPNFTPEDYGYGTGFVLEKAAEALISHKVLGKVRSLTSVRIASGAGGKSLPMKIVRIIPFDKNAKNLLKKLAYEIKLLTYETGNEHAVVRLANGERAIVSGGPGGIDFEEGQIKTLFGHTHPDSSPTSDLDEIALRPGQLFKGGQSRQFVLTAGQVIIVRPKFR